MVKILKSICSTLLVVSLLVLQSGCSMFAASTQRISVNTSEPDAQIFINGELAGTGNVSRMVPRNQSVSIMAKKDGYYPVTRDIGTQMSSTGILDIVGGCIFLLPFIGLAFPGSKALDLDSVSLVMQKAAQ